MLNIALLGASGRMGQAIAALVAESGEELRISGLWDEHSDDLAAALHGADVAIDFSHPSCIGPISAVLPAAGIPLVSGTTGHSAAELASLDALAGHVPVLHDGNMSVAVQLMSRLVCQAAASLPDYDIEITETHHRHKADAPSGTALKLGEAAAEGRGIALASNAVFDRHGSDTARAQDSIGFSTRRGGAVIGEHVVALFGEHDVVELRHVAQDRRLFAAGALQAAKWLIAQSPGKYAICDMLPPA